MPCIQLLKGRVYWWSLSFITFLLLKAFWCYWSSTQVVTNIILSFLEKINEVPFSHSILDRFWSTRSQIIHNVLFIILWRKIYDHLWNFLAKNRFRSVVYNRNNVATEKRIQNKNVLAPDSPGAEMSGAEMSSAETAAPNRRRRNVPDPYK